MKSFKSRFINALAWNAGGKLASQGISIIFGIVLARLLTPEAYGLIAMVLVFTGLASLFSDVGLGSALVQRQNLESVHFNSVYWCNVGLGSLLAAVLFMSSEKISSFYGHPEIEPIVRVLSLGFVIGAASLVHRQVLVKSMTFKYLAFADFLGMAVSGLLAIYLALIGFGFWALVFQQIANSMIVFFIVSFASGWKPEKQFSVAALRELFSFSVYVFLTRLLQYAAMRVDKLMTGRYLGASSVGLIDKAQSMMLFPLQNISHTISGVMFPALSSLQGDSAKVRRVYLKCIQAIAFLTFPMMAGMFAVSESFILGVLGKHWMELVPVFQVFCLAGVINSIATITGAVYLSQGASKLQFRVNLLTRPLVVVCVLVGLSWGVIGVAWGIVVAAWLSGLYSMTTVWRLIDLPAMLVVRILSPIILLSVVMGGFVIFIGYKFSDIEYWLLLIFQILSGIFFYTLFSMICRLDAFQASMAILRRS
jgi:O-antigen/teichoic acid export membrane protein